MHAALLVGSAGAWTATEGPGPAAQLAGLIRQQVDASGRPDLVRAAGPDGIARHASVAAGLPLGLSAVDHGGGRLAGLEALLHAVAEAADGASVLVGAAADAAGSDAPVTPAPGLAWRTTLLPPDARALLVARRAGLDPDDVAAFTSERTAAAPGHGAAALAVLPLRTGLRGRGLRVAASGRAAVDPAMGEGALIDAATAALHTAGLTGADLAWAAAATPAPALHLALARALDLPEARVSPDGLRATDCGAAAPLLALHHLAERLRSGPGRYALLAAGDRWGRGLALVLDSEPWA